MEEETMKRPFCKHLAETPLVSVIIPTLNSGKTLERCLKSIQNQKYKNIEIIVVDAFSSDETRQIVHKFAGKIFLLAKERSFARNFGAKQAKGHFLLFVDSDMELTSNAIAECVALCVFGKADAVIIPEEASGEGFLVECRKLEKRMRLKEFFGEAPRFFKSKVFQFVGGYDENLVTGEDFELAQRVRAAGFLIGRCRASITHHEENLSLKKVVSKVYYYGKKLPIYIQKEPALAFKTSSPIRFFKHTSLLRRYPIYFTGLCLLKMVEYFAYFAGFFASLSSKLFTKR
ncbi:MAG: glycosyltransferase [Candidatus Bathyarchaeia archaeon]